MVHALEPGDIRLLRTWRLGVSDALFAALWLPAFAAFRVFDLTGFLGRILVEEAS